MTVRTHSEVDALIADAREHRTAYERARDKAVFTNNQAAAKRARDAAAVLAADDVPVLVDELEHRCVEAEIAHGHMVQATRQAWAEKARADAAEAEVVRLTAELDQLRAERRDAGPVAA